MSFKQRLNNSLVALLSNNTVFAEFYKRSTGKKSDWKRKTTTLNAKEIKDWKNGVSSATDPENPRRGDLMRFYQSLYLDNHLSSVIDTRILRVQRSSFKLVDDKGKENEELKQLLERPWFEELVRLVLLSRFQGTTLIEIFDTDPDTQELDRVTEIPQSNFIAQKGIIINEEYDEKGAEYTEGTLKDYYLQIGSDWDLGMFNQLAMIVLAKKLGLGSWMSYIDKFGIPPIFAITDRMDAGRRDELFEMMQNFRQNQFVILQGNEKIEIPNNYSVDAHNTFLSLIENVCNKEISKRVLGSTGLTDEKSFVGAAEVQERIAADRYEADKLLFKFIFNSKIRQRLTKLSTIYADFDKYQLIWDNQETLDITGYIDAVQKLSSTFEFDVEEIRNRTGLPIIGAKIPSTLEGAGEKGDPQKKKTNANALANSPFGAIEGGLPTADWSDTIDEIAKQLHQGELKPEDLNRELILQTYNSLNKAAEQGYGKGYYSFEYGQNQHSPITQSMRENLFWFSGAKTYTELQELNSKLIGADGKRLSYEAFKQEAQKIHQTYNEAYLNAEYMTANRSAEAARDWQQALRNKAVLPNLKYCTMQDADVREEHAVLEGIIKPIDDPWWSTHMPPNGYRCRCYTEPTGEPASKETPVLDNLDYRFANNAGQTGEAFISLHPYFSMPKEQLARVKSQTELSKLYAPYRKIDGKQVWVNDFADPKDLKDNLEVAKLLAENESVKVKIRPHLQTGSESIKNPEFYINNKTADLKKVTGRHGIENGLKSAVKQGCKTAVLKLDYNKFDTDLLAKDLKRLYSPNKQKKVQIEEFYLVRGKKSVKITKKDVLEDKHTDLIKWLNGK